jgi:hypothetical protein
MSSAPPSSQFAQWSDPETGMQVSYSLPLFHEIDFQVNEGYRRIPHGGVEIGGVLYGRVSGKAVTLEAFRLIDCEHASGPSFLLSERDLAQMRITIQGASSDQELQGLSPVGWFIAHTRSPLRMSQREIELFEQFFPEPGRVTVLVKPEKFKPTRFAFLLRSESRTVFPDGERSSVILPLPGRGPRPASPDVPPVDMGAARTLGPHDITEVMPVAAGNQPAVPSGMGQLTEPLIRERPAGLNQVGKHEETSSLLKENIRERPSTVGRRRGSRLNWMAVILILAGLLGCAGGYWAFLQLPPAVIPLRAQRSGDHVLILWDPVVTRTARYPVMRVNDGRPMLLDDEQRETGTAEIPLSGDELKVEIIAPHWVRDSRGILRFVSLGSSQ